MDSLGKLLRAPYPSQKIPGGPACGNVSLLDLQKFKTGILDLLLIGHAYWSSALLWMLASRPVK